MPRVANRANRPVLQGATGLPKDSHPGGGGGGGGLGVVGAPQRHRHVDVKNPTGRGNQQLDFKRRDILKNYSPLFLDDSAGEFFKKTDYKNRKSPQIRGS